MRIDLNIKDTELNENNLRVQAVLPTIKFLLKNGAKVVLFSHRGRPGKVKSKMENVKWNQEFTLKPFAKIFEKLLGQPVEFANFGATVKDSDVILAENLRFLKGEEENSEKLGKQLAMLGDIYINDAFAVSHRANASVAAITKFIPSYAGLLLEKEINNLGKVRGTTRNGRGLTRKENGKHPFVVILGGEKISDKIGLINNFINKADYFLLGGGIAINFFMAQGLPIGDSICDPNADLRGIKRGLARNKNIILPIDVAIDKRRILDIGPGAVKEFSAIIKKAKTIIWNGPMGLIEDKKFRKGSDGIVREILNSKAFTVVGGGETAGLFNGKLKMEKGKKNIFISTGGGAMLEYLSGKKLPGLEALKHKNTRT